jgi:hypothetical protein
VVFAEAVTDERLGGLRGAIPSRRTVGGCVSLLGYGAMRVGGDGLTLAVAEFVEVHAVDCLRRADELVS